MPRSGRAPALLLPTHVRPRPLRPRRDCFCGAETERGRAAGRKTLANFGSRVCSRDPARAGPSSFGARLLLTPVEYRMMSQRAWMLLAILGCGLFGADSYNGPRPQKPDVPYLLHADRLVEAEVNEAREENRKGEVTYVIPGASSTAKT